MACWDVLVPLNQVLWFERYSK